MKLFSNMLERAPLYPWRGTFEGTRRIIGLLTRAFVVLAGHPSVECGLASVFFARTLFRLVKANGLLYVALYLKQCSVALQRYYGGNPIIHEPLATQVKLTRTGLPVIIPKVHRHLIRGRGPRGDKWVQVYLSWFTLAKIIQLAPRISKKTFESLVRVDYDMDTFKEILSWFREMKYPIQEYYLPNVHKRVLEKGLSWVPTWKSTPNDDRLFDRNAVPNIFTSLKYEVASFARDVRFVHSLPEGVFSPGCLFAKERLFPFDYKWNTQVMNEGLSLFEKPPYGVGHVFNDLADAYEGQYLRPGKIAQVIEGGGKRRLFAIGNYIKQRLLYPVHEWAMGVLASIPMDGTYHQERPLQRLMQLARAGYVDGNVYSFDLKSATDRFPLSVIHEVVSVFFGPTTASSIVNGTLGLNSFDISGLLAKTLKSKYFKSRKSRPPVLVSFVQGQPLGYYSSWALFSLSHHVLVWLAAEKCGIIGKFTHYALLGDDIVIADQRVAMAYRDLLKLLRVTISEPKSLVSNNGTFEFAKRYVVGFSRDLSPVSMRALIALRTSLGLCQLAEKYHIKDKMTIFRLAGAGFKARARLLSQRRGKKWQRLWTVVHRPMGNDRLSLEFWFGRGLPLNPYLKGVMVDLLRHDLRIKDLVLPPDKLTFEGERTNLEYTLYHNWLKSWLKYVLWYCTVALSPDPDLCDLFNPPMCSLTWKRTLFDTTVFKYGLIWKFHDWCGEERSLPLPLEEGRSVCLTDQHSMLAGETDQVSNGTDDLLIRI